MISYVKCCFPVLFANSVSVPFILRIILSICAYFFAPADVWRCSSRNHHLTMQQPDVPRKLFATIPSSAGTKKKRTVQCFCSGCDSRSSSCKCVIKLKAGYKSLDSHRRMNAVTGTACEPDSCPVPLYAERWVAKSCFYFPLLRNKETCSQKHQMGEITVNTHTNTQKKQMAREKEMEI